MELIDGEDLGTLLKRVGRLPPEKVSDIGQQVLSGLVAAHAHGVLHRDLCPANILIDQYGAVCITDFALGIHEGDLSALPAADALIYMAPEQLIAGGELSERTDLYAVGVVLYELLVGEPPPRTRPSSTPPSPSQRISEVDVRLEQAIRQALSWNPHDRPASAATMRAALEGQPTARRAARLTPWVAGAVLAAVVTLLAVISSRLLPRTTALSDRDTIVLADFANSTGDPVFDGTLKVALAVALEQSPFLKVFPDDRRARHAASDAAVARRARSRGPSRARLRGANSSRRSSPDRSRASGSHYVLALEAVNAETGDVMAREQVEVASKEAGADGARHRDVEAPREAGRVARVDPAIRRPLPRATTPSLEALHAYSLALDEGRVVPRVEAIPHLQRAHRARPELRDGARAAVGRLRQHRPSARGAARTRSGRSSCATGSASANGSSSRGATIIDAAQAWDKALELAASWTATYPREAFAFNSLGTRIGALGQHERAVAAFRQAIALDREFVPPVRQPGRLADRARTASDEAAPALKLAPHRGINTTASSGARICSRS